MELYHFPDQEEATKCHGLIYFIAIAIHTIRFSLLSLKNMHCTPANNTIYKSWAPIHKTNAILVMIKHCLIMVCWYKRASHTNYQLFKHMHNKPTLFERKMEQRPILPMPCKHFISCFLICCRRILNIFLSGNNLYFSAILHYFTCSTKLIRNTRYEIMIETKIRIWLKFETMIGDENKVS